MTQYRHHQHHREDSRRGYYGSRHERYANLENPPDRPSDGQQYEESEWQSSDPYPPQIYGNRQQTAEPWPGDRGGRGQYEDWNDQQNRYYEGGETAYGQDQAGRFYGTGQGGIPANERQGGYGPPRRGLYAGSRRRYGEESYGPGGFGGRGSQGGSYGYGSGSGYGQDMSAGRYGSRDFPESAYGSPSSSYTRGQGEFNRFGASFGDQGSQEDDVRIWQGMSSSARRGPKGYTRSDERIREDVCEQLSHAPYLDVGEVSVEVESGKVTLTGEVPERRMKHAIEDIADHCLGVQDVENRITVLRNGGSSSAESGRKTGNLRSGSQQGGPGSMAGGRSRKES